MVYVYNTIMLWFFDDSYQHPALPSYSVACVKLGCIAHCMYCYSKV